MPAALPLVTRQEIVRDFRLDETATIDNGIRALKDRHALSPGLSFTTRGTAGRLGGRVHLYSALNRDAARAARRKDFTTAAHLAKAAARLDASPEAKRIAVALSTIAGAGGVGCGATSSTRRAGHGCCSSCARANAPPPRYCSVHLPRAGDLRRAQRRAARGVYLASSLADVREPVRGGAHGRRGLVPRSSAVFRRALTSIEVAVRVNRKAGNLADQPRGAFVVAPTSA